MRRLYMTRLAFEGLDPEGKITVSDMEIRREGKSYSYYTVRELSGEGVELFLYCGTDMLLSFHTWNHFSEILSRCTLAYAGREAQDATLAASVEAQIARLTREYGARILTIPLDPVEISSSEIRERISRGEDVSSLLPAPVYDYIKENGLYQ